MSELAEVGRRRHRLMTQGMREDRMKFELFKGDNGLTYFHGKAENGEIILASEGYENEADARHAIDLIREDSGDAEVTEK